MNTKNFLGLVDNFEVESRMIEFGVKPEMNVNDLTDAEKSEIFGTNMELNFTLEDALELTR